MRRRVAPSHVVHSDAGNLGMDFLELGIEIIPEIPYGTG